MTLSVAAALPTRWQLGWIGVGMLVSGAGTLVAVLFGVDPDEAAAQNLGAGIGIWLGGTSSRLLVGAAVRSSDIVSSALLRILASNGSRIEALERRLNLPDVPQPAAAAIDTEREERRTYLLVGLAIASFLTGSLLWVGTVMLSVQAWLAAESGARAWTSPGVLIATTVVSVVLQLTFLLPLAYWLVRAQRSAMRIARMERRLRAFSSQELDGLIRQSPDARLIAEPRLHKIGPLAFPTWVKHSPGSV